MQKAPLIALVMIFAMSPTPVAFAKKVPQDRYRISEPLFDTQDLPPDLARYAQPSLSTATADTFHLAWYGFDSNGIPDEMGWTKVDLNDQLDTFYHVADATELDGGVPPTYLALGQLLPLSGARTLWCGQDATTEVPFCSFAKLPGYGNNWDQTLTAGPLVCDSLTMSYTVYWNSEAGYDYTDLEWSADGDDWTRLPVGGGFSATPGRYDHFGPFPGDGGYNAYLVESLGVGPQLAGAAFTGEFYLRFHSTSDGAWSGEDGLRASDGMILLDDITVERRNADGSLIDSNFEDFETTPVGSHTAGIWVGEATPGYAHYQALYPGLTVVQEDPCFSVFNSLWGFFDDPNITNYACGGFPEQGAVPRKNERSQYMFNEIWSPPIPNAGEGAIYLLGFDAYSDLNLDALGFYVWHVRNFDAGCPSSRWRDDFDVYWDNGRPKQWHRYDNTHLPMFNVSPYVDPASSHIQIALGAWDYCEFFGMFCFLGCRSHAPLFDNVHLVRVKLTGPQYAGLHVYDFFQDNFAEDGTLTGHARADIALDIQDQNNPSILPGDSAVVTVTAITTDPITSVGPSVYGYVSVWPPGQAGKTGADLEAPETREGVGKRFPLVDTQVHDGATWYCFRMDSVFTSSGSLVANKYCFDLNDWVFTPGDTVCYVIGAEDGAGHESYLSRAGDGSREFFTTPDLWTALDSPMELTILPATGWKNGGEILYVDYADGNLTQLFYDTAFEILWMDRLIDRYDATPGRSNGLGSRVKNIQNQLIDCYRTILWDAANASKPIGDGTLWEKSDDLGLLYTFLDKHPDNPGVLLAGSNMAEVWTRGSLGQSASDMKAIFIQHTLVNADHRAEGEPVSPVLTGAAICFIHSGVPDEFIAYGGCPVLRDFDLIEPVGPSVSTLRSGGGGGPSYGVQQTTGNSAVPTPSTARMMLQGFSLVDIRDDLPAFPIDRLQYLKDTITWLHTQVPDPLGVPDVPPRFANRLDHNYPNPFNPETRIHYAIKDRGVVTLRIYNAAGQLVRTLVDEVQVPREGGFSVTWDGRNNAGQAVSSGVYFYKLTANDFSETKKMVVLK